MPRMIRLMIGRDLKSLYTPPREPPRDGGCDIAGVVTTAFPDRSIDLAVRHGEILGLAGLVGAGRTSLARTVFGIDRLLGGEIFLDGKPVASRNPRDAIRHGIYLVPEDRKRAGLILDMPIRENISCRPAAVCAQLLIDRALGGEGGAGAGDEPRRSRRRRSRRRCSTLSGGNQQKVVLANGCRCSRG